MNLHINLQNLQDCRICLQKGDINIWNYKVTLKSETVLEENTLCMENYVEKSFMQLMEVFYNSQELLILTEEYPLLCWQCLEDLKFCFDFYAKIKLANKKLKNLYHESLNNYIEEEHLIENIEEDISEINEIKCIESLEQENLLKCPRTSSNEENQTLDLNKRSQCKQTSLHTNDAFVITQFVSETLEADTNERNCSHSNQDYDEEGRTRQLFTVNLKAVEVQNLDNLEFPSLPLSPEDITKAAIYMCQYCPQAFAKADYLKTHIQKSHVCKFCTQPFTITEDLYKHIRKTHTEHKCAICHKLLSSGANLRHHIRKVHRINLPARVTLLDFIKCTNNEENAPETEIEFLHEETQLPNLDFNEEYVWKNNDCIEIVNENNGESN